MFRLQAFTAMLWRAMTENKRRGVGRRVLLAARRSFYQCCGPEIAAGVGGRGANYEHRVTSTLKRQQKRCGLRNRPELEQQRPDPSLHRVPPICFRLQGKPTYAVHFPPAGAWPMGVGGELAAG